MSTLREQLDDTKVLLSASGIKGTPNEMTAWAQAAMDDPQMRIRLSVDLLRGLGADLDAAA